MVWKADFADKLPFGRGCVAAIGNFDGVHAGHRAVLAAARAEAEELRVPCVVLTFEPHPRAVLFPEKAPVRLTGLDEKVALLGEAGADGVAVLGFDKSVAGWSAEAFVQKVLVDWLGARCVCVGENFRFGHKAAGGVETLRADGRFRVRVVEMLSDAGGVVSSSRLRGAE